MASNDFALKREISSKSHHRHPLSVSLSPVTQERSCGLQITREKSSLLGVYLVFEVEFGFARHRPFDGTPEPKDGRRALTAFRLDFSW